MTEQPAVDRIPIAHTITYAVRGGPELPVGHNPGITHAPTKITLVYRAAPDSQLGRVQATVAGWWMRDGERVQPEKPVNQQYFGDRAEWPEWLAAEARLHDPERAVVQPPADRAALRDRVAEAMARADGWEWAAANFSSLSTPASDRYRRCADAVLAVLPEPTHRAAELAKQVGLRDYWHQEAMSATTRIIELEVQVEELRRMAGESGPDRCSGCRYVPCGNCMAGEERRERQERYAVAIHDAMETDLSLIDQEPGLQALFSRAAEAAMAVADALLRRMADEAQQPECSASISGNCLRESQSETACDTEAGECVHGGRPASKAQQPTDEDVVEAHRLALSFALGLGSGAPWDAIRDRAAELHDGAGAQQQPDTETLAEPPTTSWHLEILDGIWASYGPIYTDRAEAVAHYRRDNEQRPTWKDPGRTPVQRRLVRETTTYTVEEPAPVAQHPAAADADEEPQP